jgi:hypothetical protein
MYSIWRIIWKLLYNKLLFHLYKYLDVDGNETSTWRHYVDSLYAHANRVLKMKIYALYTPGFVETLVKFYHMLTKN